jgi:hypothetical protein
LFLSLSYDLDQVQLQIMAANAEKLFWKAYASAVRKAATLPDADAPVFIASHATVAVPAGDNVVPVAVTNDGVYNVSDAL